MRASPVASDWPSTVDEKFSADNIDARRSALRIWSICVLSLLRMRCCTPYERMVAMPTNCSDVAARRSPIIERTVWNARRTRGCTHIRDIIAGTNASNTSSASCHEYANMTTKTIADSSAAITIAAPVHCMSSRMVSTSPVTRETYWPRASSF